MRTDPGVTVEHDDVVVGTVVRWSTDDGWGVLRSDAIDGLAFAHFSMIRDQTGFRELHPGQRVWFRWERPGQDGCDVSAADIYSTGPPAPGAPSGPPPPDERPGAAYRSTLTITWDDRPDGSSPPRP